MKDNVLKKLEEVNLNYEYLKRQKKDKLSNLVLFIILALLISFGALFFEYSIRQKGFTSTWTLILIGFSIIIFSLTLRKYRTFNRKWKLTQARKQELDTILSLYNVQYTSDIDFEKYKNGIEEAHINIQLHQ